MNIYILTEQNRKIGNGHLARCLAIYQAFLRCGVMPKFIINRDFDKKMLLNYDIEYMTFNVRSREELLPSFSSEDTVVIDSYMADKNFYNKLYDKVKTLVCIDDFNRIDYPGHIIINGSISSEVIKYRKPKNAKLLLGSDYAPLREAFCDVPNKTIKKKIKSILVYLRCKDKRFSHSLISALNARLDCRLNIVCAYSDLKFRRFRNVFLYNNIAEDAMKRLMLEADLAISGGGQITYELACIGVPMVGICLADNQLFNLTSWSRAGVIKYMGWHDKKGIIDKTIRYIERLTYDKRLSMSQNGKKYVDGAGADRVVAVILGKIYDKVNLKILGDKDCQALYALIDQNHIRKAAFNPKHISYKEHKKWFSVKVKDKNTLILAFEKAKISFAQCRLEKRKDGVEIGISVDERYCGKGMGKLILRMACDFLKIYRKKWFPIVAHIKPDNIQSLRTFQVNGFEYFRETFYKSHHCFEFKKQLYG